MPGQAAGTVSGVSVLGVGRGIHVWKKPFGFRRYHTASLAIVEILNNYSNHSI